MSRPRVFFIAMVMLCTRPGLLRAAERVTLDKPIRVTLQKTDKTRVAGQIVSYSADDLLLNLGGDRTALVGWDELDAKDIFNVHASLLGPKEGRAWIDVGRQLLGANNGKDWADKAFARAIKADPKLSDDVKAARLAGPATRPVAGLATDYYDQYGGITIIGDPDPKYWQKPTDEEQADSVKALTALGALSKSVTGTPLELQETHYFLVYSDLKAADAAECVTILDKAYLRLADMFALEKGQNVFRGKLLVFVLSRGGGELPQLPTSQPVVGNACQCLPDGTVRLVIFKRSDDNRYLHAAVHEMTHAFLFRYHKLADVAPWAMEGLCEAIADDVAPNGAGLADRDRDAARYIKSRRSMLSFFSDDRVDAGVAESLAGYMIKMNRKRYVDFITGMKDGLTWEASLEKKYGTNRSRLSHAYAGGLGINLNE